MTSPTLWYVDRGYKPVWIGVGALSADLMLAVLITTALRRRSAPAHPH